MYNASKDGKECTIFKQGWQRAYSVRKDGKECTEKMTVGWRDHSHRGLLDVVRGVFSVEEVEGLQSALYGHTDAGRPGTGPGPTGLFL